MGVYNPIEDDRKKIYVFMVQDASKMSLFIFWNRPARIDGISNSEGMKLEFGLIKFSCKS